MTSTGRRRDKKSDIESISRGAKFIFFLGSSYLHHKKTKIHFNEALEMERDIQCDFMLKIAVIAIESATNKIAVTKSPDRIGIDMKLLLFQTLPKRAFSTLG